MNKNEVLEKIRKLLALTRSPVQAEAEAALVKAHEFMMKWAVEEHELQGGGKTEFVEVIIHEGKQVPFEYKMVGSILHQFFNVRCVRMPVFVRNGFRAERMHRLVCFGTSSNTEFAVYVASFLIHTFNRLWFSTAHQFRLNSTYRKRYIAGLTAGFKKYLTSQQQQMESECKALMVIGKELTKAYYDKFPDTHINKVHVENRNEVDHAVYQKGKQDGEKIRVSRQVDQNQRGQLE